MFRNLRFARKKENHIFPLLVRSKKFHAIIFQIGKIHNSLMAFSGR